MSNDAADIWDQHAATFDDEPDHGLRDPTVRDAWIALLMPVLPDPPASIVDLGCGTGSLSILLAQAGHDVHGLDSSHRMLDEARGKASRLGVAVTLHHGDASRPPFQPASFDVVLVRHVLWALPDPASALAHWVTLLRPQGRLVLIEGRWMTGAGLSAADCTALLRQHRKEIGLQVLDDQALWGRAITDERYLLLSRR
ncbi:class I SAM-dependent methyltransferase [Plantactinospora sp. KLBMP9567]|uniref:class I SAM-dependent methyltransferase n=1 Tax=Plantactinospora sp. KLBMP9567 TaxID=3085900 RepID=UPI0029819D6F|nr:class I SAM-dependent methyltransferase [Plantactinospora sp. KLBMP9567]MDW5323826.1 class I SAM-dependent methyltransferase [Plantactinospora sp. KLBMP9567]